MTNIVRSEWYNLEIDPVVLGSYTPILFSGFVPIKILVPVANPNAKTEIIIPTNIFPLIFSFINKHFKIIII